MSAVQALAAARVFGVHLELDGDDLLLKAAGPPPDVVRAALACHKPEVVRLLHSCRGRLLAGSLAGAHFHERVNLCPARGGLPRGDAEVRPSNAASSNG